MVIALYGDLGTGKTTLTQGIAQGMGITARVTSPTFTLVNEYRGETPDGRGLRLIHVDTYRLGDTPEQAVLEAETFGLDEILDGDASGKGNGAVVVIEWAERIASRLPPDHLRIEITHTNAGSDVREINCSAFGSVSAAILVASFPCEQA
jgi:tRNA threonylcarbamoyladenosine biosynthesis protein TsaE